MAMRSPGTLGCQVCQSAVLTALSQFGLVLKLWAPAYGAPASCPSVSVFEAAKYSEVAVFAELNAMLAAPLRNALVPSISPGFTGFFVCVQMKGAELQVQLTQYLLNCADAHTQLAA